MNLDKLFGVLSGLSGTYRFANAKLSNPESVLEHTGAVVLTCYIISREMNVLSPGSVEIGDVLSKAAVHDVEELLLGDTPRPTKYSSEEARKLFHHLSGWAMDRILTDLKIQCWQSVQVDHKMAKRGPEGTIVELADVLAVVYKINEEALERGNRTMLSRASSCGEQLDKCRSKINREAWDQGVKTFLLSVVRQGEEMVAIAEAVASVSAISEDAAE